MILEVSDLFTGFVACVIGAEYKLIQLAHHHAAPLDLTDLLRSAREHDARHVGPDPPDEHPGYYAVARGQEHQSVEQLDSRHYFN